MIARIGAAGVLAGLILVGCGSPPRSARREAGETSGIETTSPVAGVRDEPVPAARERAPASAGESSSCSGPVRVSGQGFFDYMFTGAPTDWRAAAGTWRIAPRWADPWYTFFCGWPDRASGDKAAVIWNKRSFSGDLTLDLHVGPKMERRRGRRYEYMQDINVTIAADGRDLTSGYTFTFAGFDNTRSAILRGGDVLAESTDESAKMARNMQIHYRWWHIRVMRRGERLRFTVDFMSARFVDLKCTDPAPLTGDRIAIWSYDCGIALARVRISGLPGNLAQTPDFEPPRRTRTYYDIVSR